MVHSATNTQSTKTQSISAPCERFFQYCLSLVGDPEKTRQDLMLREEEKEEKKGGKKFCFELENPVSLDDAFDVLARLKNKGRLKMGKICESADEEIFDKLDEEMGNLSESQNPWLVVFLGGSVQGDCKEDIEEQLKIAEEKLKALQVNRCPQCGIENSVVLVCVGCAATLPTKDEYEITLTQGNIKGLKGDLLYFTRVIPEFDPDDDVVDLEAIAQNDWEEDDEDEEEKEKEPEESEDDNYDYSDVEDDGEDEEDDED